MWYKSIFTNRIIHRKGTEYVLNSVFGKGYFDDAVAKGDLVQIPDPEVEYILKETHSINLAAARYMEIHQCNATEARESVRNIAVANGIEIGNKGGKTRSCKKNAIAKTANTENLPDTDK